MSSRRLMTRSYSGEGRSSYYNGDDGNGTSRPGSRSYLSNVRPENRSTLCSVMAQLMEETQPSFETTLKSKAVSETSNVKFTCVVTGYPTPEITWYKDDMQLDRYCGLPKYEIFRDGQNHSLHIYNCTVDDAAIYQASAANTKGIVSCSGVLEVGVMSEYKIHQRYFATLKQKAENKRRELEGKENQGPGGRQDQLRTISPDRSQRKRRSPMEASLSTPSSMEDEGTEESHEAPVAEGKARLQETAMGDVGEKPVPVTTRAASPITNGQAAKENGNKGLLYAYNSVQKTVTAHQPKTPFAKKKIKISNGTESAKANTLADMVSEERGVSVEAGVASAPTQSIHSQVPSKEVMEVENNVYPSAVASNHIKATENCQKAATEKALPVKNMPVAKEKVRMEGNVVVPSHKKQPVVPRSSTPLSSRNVTSSETERKQTAKLEKDRKVRHNEKAENHKLQSSNPPFISSQLPLSPVVIPPDPSNSTVREDVSKTEQQEDVAVMEVEQKPLAAEPQHQTATPLLGKAVNNMAEDGPQSSHTSIRRAPVCTIGLVSEESPRESEAASPRRPCEPFGHQLFGEETSPSLRNASASRPPQLGKVTQAHTHAKRNDAPVKSGPLPTRCEMAVQSPQRPPSGKEATADDGQMPTSYNPNQSPADEMTQVTWDHSKGSNESHAVPFTDLQKSPLERLADGKNTPGCNISPAVRRGQVEIAIKTVGGTEIQVDKKVEGNEEDRLEVQVDKKVEGNEEGRLEVLGDNLASTEGKVEVENQVVPQNRSEQVKIEWTKDAREKEVTVMTIIDASHNETERNAPVLKRAEEIPAHPKSPKLKPTKLETVVPVITKNPDEANFQNTNMSEQQIENFKEIPTPVSKVISIAELLRAQLKAIGAEPVADSVTAKSQTPVDNTPFSTTTKTQHAAEKRPGLRIDHPPCRLDPEKPQLRREMEARVDTTPPVNIEAEHLEVQHRPAKPEHKQVQSPNAGTPTIKAELRPMQSLCAGTPTIDALRKPFVVPPISVIDVGSPLEIKEPSSSTVKDNDSVMDTGQQSGALPSVHLKDNTSTSLSGTDNVQIDLSPIMQEEDLISAAPTRSNPPIVSPPEHNQPLANTIVEMDSGHSPATTVGSQHSIVSSVMEHDNEKRVQIEDLVFTPSLTPEMQLISEAHVRSTQTGSTTLLDQHKDNKPTAGGSQTTQKLTTESALGPETQGINTPLTQRESSPSTIDEYSNNDSFTPLMDAESSPLLRKGNGAPSSIPAATPRELASGARRKIFIPKPKGEDSEATSPDDTQPPREEVAPKKSSKLSPSANTPSVSPSLSRRSPLVQPPSGQQTPPAEQRSPLLSKKKVALETPAPSQEPPQQIDTPKTEEKPAKDKHNPFKAPQVIRKIRGEPFSDALGHLKLWCQFFNVLSDSTIKWYRDEVEIAEVKRSAGDETQVALAIVQASSRDCGVYGCTIANEYGTDSTDFLLSVDILSGMFLREDLEVGEEIEMTPLLFNKGLADSGVWGNKFFGRVMIKESHVGEGSSHKAWRAKVIYGLEPVFESGNTCLIKVHNPIAYGGKEESNLIERNLNIAQQECRIQNMAREYCKIFSAESRVIENFGVPLEVIPVYMMYRPANAIPHATVEADLKGVYLKYCLQDATGRLVMRTGSEVEQKCCALQHWVHQWTNGNLLLIRLEGVDTKITNVGISVKSTGYQGLSAEAGNPKLFEQFLSQHQCNYYCGLLSLRPLKTMDSLQTPSKAKASRSPLLLRKMVSGSSSPQTGRKAAGSPRLARKSESEPDGGKAPAKPKAADASKAV